jgi:hypothetical protein
MLETCVDLISIGWLTHSAPTLDIGLDFIKGAAAKLTCPLSAATKK